MVPEVLSQVPDIGSPLLSVAYPLTSLDSQRFFLFYFISMVFHELQYFVNDKLSWHPWDKTYLLMTYNYWGSA